ncbi:hypothetical protein [Cellulomonas sp. SLBN-39]|uniref:hypothetical protein n=1 Tax=Cellulomonas sp. SLBN-39 TaxID=2768446 RepID=UPI001151097B|nr:hypothetical protein [Cellulomonas sp. SLBN-39]TQL01855.1 hypothetical protein FBY24_0915 [Cellulomonas sp. SLBN-39]
MKRPVPVMAAVCLALLPLLAACSPDAAPQSTATPGRTVTAAPPAEPSPTPSPEVQDLSDPDLGIVFEDVPTDLTGDDADVYTTVATFQVEYWRTMTTNAVSPAFAVIGAAEISTLMEQIVATNVGVDARIGGVFRTRLSEVVVDGDDATVVACDDYAAVTFEDADGPDTPESAGFGEPTLKTVSLTRQADGPWLVGASVPEGTC